MQGYLRAAVAALVLGSALIGRGVQPSARAAHLAAPIVDRIFAGLEAGSVYASDDRGDSWRETDSGMPPTSDVTSLAVAPGGRTIYAGTGGAGLYASGDGGRSWHDANDGNRWLGRDQVRSVLVSPANGQLVYAGLIDSTVARSYDGGTHWLFTVLPIGNLTTMAIDAGRPSTLLAGSAGDGLWISTDGGTTWHLPDRNIPAYAAATAIAASPATPDVIYAGTSDGVYQSIDGGATWLRASRGIPDRTPITAVAVDPLHGTRVVAGNKYGDLYRSLDGGTSWTQTGSTNGWAIHALLYDPARPGTVLAGTARPNIYRSTDGGATWSSPGGSPLPSAIVYCMAVSLRAALPTDPVAPPATALPGVRYFAQTGHTVRGSFYACYRTYGDLKIFGLPLTEAFSDHGQLVQYFERAELTLTAYGVGEAPLGSLLTAGRAFPPAEPSPSTEGSYFPVTGHTLSGRFLTFWGLHHGGLLFGDPISEPLREQNGDGTGRSYQVQYFQDARLEYHPELAGTDNEVQIGLLGRQYLQRIGLL